MTSRPMRYGAWDPALEFDAPLGVYDLVVIGAPPPVDGGLAPEAVAETRRAVLVEKPLCGPDLRGAEELRTQPPEPAVAVFGGYDDVVSEAAAHRAAQERRTVRIDGSAGWRPETVAAL